MAHSEETKNIGLRGITIADTMISHVDGKEGKLLYRGFTIQDLAKDATFEEVIYLLLMGTPPNQQQLADLSAQMASSRQLTDENIAMLRARAKSATPMDVLQGAVTGLADDDPFLNSEDRQEVSASCLRLISRLGLVAAAWQRLRSGQEPVTPSPDQSSAAAFLEALWGRKATPGEERLMDLLLVLHAEHSFNASTFSVRQVASTQANLYASVSAGVGALSGALHGGANAKVMAMLLDIGEQDRVESWIEDRLQAGGRIMGLGHAVYHTEDPRAAILRKTAEEVLKDRPEEKWFRLALEVEKIGRAMLLEKKNQDRYANVDFYASPVLHGIGFPIDMFPVFFAVSRVSGWCAHYLEERFAEAQPKPALYRPSANYTGKDCGPNDCVWTPINQRT